MFTSLKNLSSDKVRQLSPVTLAFIGDAVYSLYIRQKVVTEHDLKPNDYQKITSSQVSAHGQNELLAKIESMFTEEEQAIFHRGRNAKKSTKSKNASVAEYNRSTGFEAVMGYLYLTGQYDRICQLIEAGNEN
jgi:ribonuclease-3 family protein